MRNRDRAGAGHALTRPAVMGTVAVLISVSAVLVPGVVPSTTVEPAFDLETAETEAIADTADDSGAAATPEAVGVDRRESPRSIPATDHLPVLAVDGAGMAAANARRSRRSDESFTTVINRLRAEPSTTTTASRVEPVIEPEAKWVDAGHGVAVPDVLLRIRFCESTNDYRAAHRVSSARGAYQFLTKSWNWYGHADRYGVASADQATPAQQDEAAVMTLRRSGTRPWAASKHCWASASINPNYATFRPARTTATTTTTTSAAADSSTTTSSTTTSSTTTSSTTTSSTTTSSTTTQPTSSSAPPTSTSTTGTTTTSSTVSTTTNSTTTVPSPTTG